MTRHIGIVTTMAMAAAALAAGCKKKQTYTGAMKLICDKGRIQKVVAGAPFADWPALMVGWGQTNIQDPRATEVLKALVDVEPSQREGLLLSAKNDVEMAECGTAELFAPAPLLADTRDAAAQAWAMGVGREMVKAFLGRPFDPALQGPDATADARKLDCAVMGADCKVPGDHWSNDKNLLENKAEVIGVEVEVLLHKGDKYLRLGFIAWDETRSQKFGRGLFWTARAAPEGGGTPTLEDAGAVTTAAPALTGFVDRTLPCLVPPGCVLPGVGATSFGGSVAEGFGRDNDLDAVARALGREPDATSGWTPTFARVRALVTSDDTDEHKISVMGNWMSADLKSRAGRFFLGPIDHMHSAHL